jgi:hypothetical protein
VTVVPLPAGQPVAAVLLRATVRDGGLVTFSWSPDAQRWHLVNATPFKASVGRWVGAKIGLFALGSPEAHADFHSFQVTEPAMP